MSDRLQDVKNALERLKSSPHCYDPNRVKGVAQIQDLVWCVREIEHLRGKIREREDETE